MLTDNLWDEIIEKHYCITLSEKEKSKIRIEEKIQIIKAEKESMLPIIESVFEFTSI
jgi:hypothetical protein